MGQENNRLKSYFFSASDLLLSLSYNDLCDKLKVLFAEFKIFNNLHGIIFKQYNQFTVFQEDIERSINWFNLDDIDDKKTYIELDENISREFFNEDKISLLGVYCFQKTRIIFIFKGFLSDNSDYCLSDPNLYDCLEIIYPFLLASLSGFKINRDFKTARKHIKKNDFLIKVLDDLAKSLTGAVSTKKIGHIFLLTLTGYTSASFSALYLKDLREDNFFKLVSYTGNLNSLPQSIRVDESSYFTNPGVNFYKFKDINDQSLKDQINGIFPDLTIFLSSKTSYGVRCITFIGRKFSGHEMNEEDLRLISLIAQQIQTPLKNSFFYEEIERQNRHLLEMNKLLKKEIVERKKAEISEERTSLKFQTIIETAKEGFLELDEDNLILNLNPEMCSIFQKPKDEVIGRSIFNFIEETFSENGFCDEHLSKQFEVIFKGSHGKNVNCLVNISAFESNDLSADMKDKIYPAKFALVTDISELKEKETSLAEFKKLISASKDIIAIVNKDHSIIPMNKEARLMFENCKCNLDHFIVNSGADFDLKQKFENSFNGHVCSLKFWYRFKDNEKKAFYDFILYPYEESRKDARYDRLILIMRDITDIKELEIRLVQSQKMEAIGTLAGGIAHDFNNILSGIIGYSELASLKIDKDSLVSSYILKIRDAGYRATELIKQILSFSRSGVNETENKPLRVMPVIKEALKLLKVSLPSTIIMETKFEKNKFIVNSNPTSIHQIIMNLCTNAAHAMSEGGKLIVKGFKFIIDPINNNMFPELALGEYLCIRVEDTGVGIPNENREKIFEPFFTTKLSGKGTGIGLSVTLNLIRSMKGILTVESVVGKGSVFTVYLPLLKLESNSDRSIPEDEFIKGGNERILLVDDDSGIIEVMSMILINLGYEVVTFTSALDALEAFKKNSSDFDLAILDQTMPYLTGINLSMELVKIKPDLPVILSSGYSCDQYREQFYEYGIKDFILKPINRQKLGITLRKILDSSVNT